MSSTHNLQYAERANAEEFRRRKDGEDFDILKLTDAAGSEVQIFMVGRMLGCATDMAHVFKMRRSDSQFLGLLDLLLMAESDPNRDTIADLVRAVQIHADACCPVCGQYRPDEDEWHEIDGRVMCASCCDDEAARRGADMEAARLDAADHEYDRRAEVA